MLNIPIRLDFQVQMAMKEIHGALSVAYIHRALLELKDIYDDVVKYDLRILWSEIQLFGHAQIQNKNSTQKRTDKVILI